MPNAGGSSVARIDTTGVTCKFGELSLDGGSRYQAMNGDITNAESHVVMYNGLHGAAA